MNTQIALSIDAQGIGKKFQAIFTNTDSFIRELLQNSRRANATSIRISIHEDFCGDGCTMSFQDDGDGIDDFQNLLTISRSGWDSKTVEAENAFGMGFMSAIYASKRMMICSNGAGVILDRESVLAGKQFTVEAADVKNKGCGISMFGIEVSKSDLIARIEIEADGFPLPVFVNNNRISSLSADRFASSKDCLINGHVDGIGRLLVDESKVSTANSYGGCKLFLLGSPVGGREHWDFWRYSASRYKMADLDPKHYMARMPDRDVLVDMESATAQIDTLIKAAILDALKQKAATMSGKDFVLRYQSLIEAESLGEIYNQIDCIPGQMFFKWLHHPLLLSEVAEDHYQPIGHLSKNEIISRSDIESGVVKVLLKDEALGQFLRESKVDGFFAAKHALAFSYGWFVMGSSSSLLSKNHWIWKHALSDQSLNIAVDVVGAESRSIFDCSVGDDEAVVYRCDGFNVRWSGGSLSVDWPMADYADGVSKIYIPRKCTDLRSALMTALYLTYDDDGHEEVQYEAEVLESRILRADGVDLHEWLSKVEKIDKGSMPNGIAVIRKDSHGLYFSKLSDDEAFWAEVKARASEIQCFLNKEHAHV